MRHKLTRHRLNRFTSWREATLKSVARNLLIRQSIKTSMAKAKAAQPLVEKLITLARHNNLSARRQAFEVLQDHLLVRALFTEIGPRFVSRNGGYTRIINLGQRRGDNAKLVLFELTEIKKKEPAKAHKGKDKETADAEIHPETPVEQPHGEKKPSPGPSAKEKPPMTKKPSKKFLGGLRNIFKKERDSL